MDNLFDEWLAKMKEHGFIVDPATRVFMRTAFIAGYIAKSKDKRKIKGGHNESK